MTIIVDYLIFCLLLQFLRELSPKMLAIQNVQRKRKLEVTSLSEAVGLVSMLLDFIQILCKDAYIKVLYFVKYYF